MVPAITQATGLCFLRWGNLRPPVGVAGAGLHQPDSWEPRDACTGRCPHPPPHPHPRLPLVSGVTQPSGGFRDTRGAQRVCSRLGLRLPAWGTHDAQGAQGGAGSEPLQGDHGAKPRGARRPGEWEPCRDTRAAAAPQEGSREGGKERGGRGRPVGRG